VVTKDKKGKIVKDFATHGKDTGSPEVQVALLTQRISELTEHFKTHVKDFNSRRGMLCLISQRRRLLEYLQRKNVGRYKTVVDRLGLRH
jgi:small subunit ribosomal protein S15